MPTHTTPVKPLECFTFQDIFHHEQKWVEYEEDLAGRLKVEGFQALPGATDILTSYRDQAELSNHEYAVVITHPEMRYLILFPRQPHYITFMRSVAPLAGIINRILPQ